GLLAAAVHAAGVLTADRAPAANDTETSPAAGGAGSGRARAARDADATGETEGPGSVRSAAVPAAGAIRSAVVLVAGAAGVVLVGLAVPAPVATGPPVVVAYVQGNVPRMGLDFNAQRRAVLDNHVEATLAL